MITNVTSIFDNGVLESIDPGALSFGRFEGWYGSIHKFVYKGQNYALKVFKDTMHKEVSNNKIAAYDYVILKDLKKSIHYPTLHAYKDKEWMITDWIDGEPFREVDNKEFFFSQLYNAYQHSIDAGWYPDDVKGDNLIYHKGKVTIIDVGSYLPVIPDLDYNIAERVDFVIKHAHIYPSVRDESPYKL